MVVLNMSKHVTYKDELTAFYNEVEEAITAIFESYEKAAKWFDTHVAALDSLWAYGEEKYVIGWSAIRVANQWYCENVAALPAALPTTLPAKPRPLIRVYYESPKIEPEILIARSERAEDWRNAYL